MLLLPLLAAILVVACGRGETESRAAVAPDSTAGAVHDVVERFGERVSVDPPSSDAEAIDSGPPAAGAVDLIQRYYAAIDDGRFREAYDLWEGDGAASGQSFEAFAAGFAETAAVRVEMGEPGRIHAAAGSRYIDVPVTITAITADSVRQRFEGSYTLRRAVADGASAEQRQWHIYAAHVARRD